MNFQVFKLDLEKAEEPEIKVPKSIFKIIENATECQKNIYHSPVDYAKDFDCVEHNELRKILQEMGIPDLPSEKSVCRSRNSYNWTWDNRLVPNWERSMSRLYIVTLLI